MAVIRATLAAGAAALLAASAPAGAAIVTYTFSGLSYSNQFGYELRDLPLFDIAGSNRT